MKAVMTWFRPVPLLRAEGGALLVLALLAFAHLEGNWLVFALLLLVPDLSMVGYFAGPCVGAVAYNLAHALIAPATLAAWGIATGNTMVLSLAAIWFAHIGMDRLLGYGLKEPDGFGHTHLGTKGQQVRVASTLTHGNAA